MKLAVALTFPVYPPLGGGQVRVLNLYRQLALTFDVELVTLAPVGAEPARTQLAPGLWETRVPKTVEHAAAELSLEAAAGTVVTDVAMYRLYPLTPEYLTALRTACHRAAAVVASHPYTLGAIRAVSDIPLCYEAHNVEAQLKAALFSGSSKAARTLLGDVQKCEGTCCREALLTWTCSAEDRTELIRRYGADPARVVVAPNGADLDELVFRPPTIRRQYKQRLGLQDRYLATFIASWHQPNVAAATRLLELARERPEVDFLILGSVGQALGQHALPANVDLMGPVSSGLKLAVLGTVDVALNPVTTGSGTNIKMLDYFGSGVPVVSSAFGARGLGVQPGEHYVQAEPAALGAGLDSIGSLVSGQVEAMVLAARHHVEAQLSWPRIGEQLCTRLEAALRDARSTEPASALSR